jgi:hypothetical protein
MASKGAMFIRLIPSTRVVRAACSALAVVASLAACSSSDSTSGSDADGGSTTDASALFDGSGGADVATPSDSGSWSDGSGADASMATDAVSPTDAGPGDAANGSDTTNDAATMTDAMAADSAGPVDAGPLGPKVQILHPGSGVDRTVGVSIYFHGTATDPTDGMLSGNALVWTDSLEGKFGTGDPVMWAPTVLGAHTITLNAVDSLNYGATSSVTFNIIP